MRKPFDILAEGLVAEKSRGGSRCSFVNQTEVPRLVRQVFPQSLAFERDAILHFVESRVYRKHRKAN
jgi:hypothetical protein